MTKDEPKFSNTDVLNAFKPAGLVLTDGNSFLSTVLKLSNWQGPANNSFFSNPPLMTLATGLTTMSSVLVHVYLRHMARAGTNWKALRWTAFDCHHSCAFPQLIQLQVPKTWRSGKEMPTLLVLEFSFSKTWLLFCFPCSQSNLPHSHQDELPVMTWYWPMCAMAQKYTLFQWHRGQPALCPRGKTVFPNRFLPAECSARQGGKKTLPASQETITSNPYTSNSKTLAENPFLLSSSCSRPCLRHKPAPCDIIKYTSKP